MNRLKHSIKDMQMYALPQAEQFLSHEGLQTTTNILPIAYVTQAMKHITPWACIISGSNQTSKSFFFPSTFDDSVFKPHLSLENRDPLNNPLPYVVYAEHMVDVFALQLKQGQRNSVFPISVSVMPSHAHLDIVCFHCSSTEQFSSLLYK